jgi:thiamine-monophosphate kinase
VHFFPDDPADVVAKKTLRVNLSDLAAKGARPLGFLLALALPREIGPAWLEPLARGLGEYSELFAFPLLGGDTDCTPGPLTISIAALGAAPHGKMVRRSSARSEDRVVVTGSIGDAALGPLRALAIWSELLAKDPHHPPIRTRARLFSTGTLTLAMPVEPGECWTTTVVGIPLEEITIRFS